MPQDVINKGNWRIECTIVSFIGPCDEISPDEAVDAIKHAMECLLIDKATVGPPCSVNTLVHNIGVMPNNG